MNNEDIVLTEKKLPDKLLQQAIDKNPEVFVDEKGNKISSDELREILSKFVHGHKDLLASSEISESRKKYWVKKDFEYFVHLGRKYKVRILDLSKMSESEKDKILIKSSDPGIEIDNFDKSETVDAFNSIKPASKYSNLKMNIYFGGGLFLLIIFSTYIALKRRK
tara:strand:+ start:3425 stop:3919 length:495 start_codon:yes stop_codon:yes gene_type:complete